MRLVSASPFAALTFVALGGLGACAAPEELEPADLDEAHAPIIHGSPTPQGQFPVTGALLYTGGGGLWGAGCTGTLVAPDVVITAAHCLRDDIAGPGLPRFTLAHDARILNESETLAARSKHPHPGFDLRATSEVDAPAQANDIGVLLLAEPLNGLPYATLATGPESAMLTAPTPATIVGYGLTTPGGQSAGIKYNADTPITQVGQWEIYLGNPGDPQNCNGDSGGPAFAAIAGNVRFVGVTSRGITTCSRGGLNTRVEPYTDWINEVLAANCGEGGTCELPTAGGGGGGDDGGCGCVVGGRAAASDGAMLVGLGLGVALLARRRRQGRTSVKA